MAFMRNSKEWRIITDSAVVASFAYEYQDTPQGWNSPNSGKAALFVDKNGFWYSETKYNLAARILVKEGTATLAFTGTDDDDDTSSYDTIFFDEMLGNRRLAKEYSEIVEAFITTYKKYDLIITGHSLGGAVVNELASHREKFEIPTKTRFVAFSSPVITDKSDILNFGFNRGDPVFEMLNPGDSISRPSSIFFVGNSPKQVSFDFDPHSMNAEVDALFRLKNTELSRYIGYDSKIIIIGAGVDGSNASYEKNTFNSEGFSEGGYYILGMDKLNFGGKSYGEDYKTVDDLIYATEFGDSIDGMSGNDVLIGYAGDDIIYGGRGNDELRGGAGKDALYGGAGNDIFVFATNDVESGEVIDGGSVAKGELNTINGYGRVDFREASITNINRINLYDSDTDWKFSGNQVEEFLILKAIFSGSGNIYIGANVDKKDYSLLDLSNFTGTVTINSTDSSDKITGTSRSDLIFGQGGNDVMRGGIGDDTLNGGAGADKMFGGEGNDIFVFWTADIFAPTTTVDTIEDFQTGDRIDLRPLDSSTTSSGTNGAVFIGKASFSGEAGELRYTNKGSNTEIQLDRNGDKISDFNILLRGAHTLDLSDFLGVTAADGDVFNGHTYRAVNYGSAITWAQAKALAEAAGGHLATITSAEENEFVYSLLDPSFEPPDHGHGAWLGGYQDADATSPDEGWHWVTGEAWVFTAWAAPNPEDGGFTQNEDVLEMISATAQQALWNDLDGNNPNGDNAAIRSYIIEFDYVV